MFLYSFHILCAGGILLPFQAKIQVAEALYEHGDDPGTVSRIHVHGCRLLYLKGNRTDRRESDQSGAGLGFQIAKGFFDTIPIAVDEAALLDGCTRWQIFSRITLPLSKPIIIYTVLTSFMAPWLDFIFAKVICRANSDQYTIAIGLWKMLEKEYIDSWYTSFAAGAVLISIPIAILFLFMQRYYVDGVSGAVKG